AAAARMATTAHRAHGSALGANTGQIMALTHVARSMTEQLAMGVPVTQALTGQLSHLSYVMSGPGGLMGALRAVGGLLAPLLPAFGIIAAAVGTVAIGFAGLTTEINRNQKTQVSWMDTVKATVELGIDAFARMFKGASEPFAHLWDTISPYVSATMVGLIQMFDLAFLDIKTIFSHLPAALGESAIASANAVISAIDGMIQKYKLQIAQLLTIAQMATTPFGGGAVFGTALGALAGATGNTKPLDNPFEGTGAAGRAELAANRDHVSSFDYLGMIGDRARKDKLAAADDSAKKLGKTLSGPLTDGIDTLTAKANVFADAITGAFSNMGTGLIDAFKKGGNIVGSIFDMLLNKVGQLGESLLNSGLNSILNSVVGGAFAPATGGAFGNGLWGSAIFAGVHHSGGVAGSPSIGRNVPASVFDGAQRYHGGGIAGLRPDEVPAILQKGERVIPKGANQNGDIHINFNVPNGTRESVTALKQWVTTGGFHAEVRKAVDNRTRAN
ncbi:MAG: hypothetical protein ABI216_00630, partial [Devosia sp.]